MGGGKNFKSMGSAIICSSDALIGCWYTSIISNSYWFSKYFSQISFKLEIAFAELGDAPVTKSFSDNLSSPLFNIILFVF